MGPNDYAEPMRDRLRTESDNLMLVGHLPYLSRLVAMLLGVRKDHTVVEFRMDRSDSGEWIVRWVVPPELLPAFLAREQPGA